MDECAPMMVLGEWGGGVGKGGGLEYGDLNLKKKHFLPHLV